RLGGARAARGRRPRARTNRPRAHAGDRRALRRRPGRPLHAGRGSRRGTGHGRGRLRAVPPPARLHPAHPARPNRDEARPSPHGRREEGRSPLLVATQRRLIVRFPRSIATTWAITFFWGT